MSLTNLLVPTFRHLLRGMSGWFDKAAVVEVSAGAVPGAFLALRLAEGMYPLASQIRFTCFQAQEPIFLLRGLPIPEAVADVRRSGWDLGEHQGTWADMRADIRNALAALDDLGPGALDDWAGRPVTLELPTGMIFDMTGAEYARDWALPQFYFHLTTAYGILRHHGVDVGKADYVPYMLRYLRAGTMPNA